MNTAWHRSELAYCTNVHPGESLEQVSGIIHTSLRSVRQNRGLSRMSAGLWLSNPVVQQLSSATILGRFTEQLEQNAISVFTLNGFPMRGFHSKRVKQAVYHPDWSEPQRLEYTLKLARILATLLPHNASEGSISSVPLGFAPDWDDARQNRALNAIGRCLAGLEEIHRQTGRRIRLCLEMEPGCVLETTGGLLAFFSLQLPEYIAKQGLDPELIHKHLGICFDVCHQAVMFEDCYESLRHIHAAGIFIGKIQISSALELKNPDDREARASLGRFAEPKYLHQSCCRNENGQLLRAIDLDQAFTTFPATHPWRVHFHVPVQAETLICDGLGTTQREIGRTLDFLRDNPDLHPHLEVETYTWTALPQHIRPTDEHSIIDGLSAELVWLEAQMRKRGLLQEEST